MNGEKYTGEPIWVTYAEAQRLVGMGRTSLYLACRSGEIRTARVGRRVLLSRDSLLAFVERAAEPDKESR